MNKLDRLVSNSIFKLILPVLAFLVVALFGALYAQTRDDVTENKIALQQHCEKNDKAFSGKVDNKHLKTVLDMMQKDSERQWETTQELIKGVKKLQTDVTIIKEKIK